MTQMQRQHQQHVHMHVMTSTIELNEFMRSRVSYLTQSNELRTITCSR